MIGYKEIINFIIEDKVPDCPKCLDQTFQNFIDASMEHDADFESHLECYQYFLESDRVSGEKKAYFLKFMCNNRISHIIFPCIKFINFEEEKVLEAFESLVFTENENDFKFIMKLPIEPFDIITSIRGSRWKNEMEEKLRYFVYEGDFFNVKKLLSYDFINPKKCLHIASYNQFEDAVKLLLDDERSEPLESNCALVRNTISITGNARILRIALDHPRFPKIKTLRVRSLVDDKNIRDILDEKGIKILPLDEGKQIKMYGGCNSKEKMVRDAKVFDEIDNLFRRKWV